MSALGQSVRSLSPATRWTLAVALSVGLVYVPLAYLAADLLVGRGIARRI